jgi:hypothetical protein
MKTIAVEEHYMIPALFGYSAGTKNIARLNIRPCRCPLRPPLPPGDRKMPRAIAGLPLRRAS